MRITLTDEEILNSFSCHVALCVILVKERHRDFTVRELLERCESKYTLSTIKTTLSRLNKDRYLRESDNKRCCSVTSRVCKAYYISHLPTGMEMAVEARIYKDY